MEITITPCRLRHPDKHNYAGCSPAHLIHVHGYEMTTSMQCFAEAIRQKLGEHSLDRQVIVVRVVANEMTPDHQGVLLELVAEHGCYSGDQAILFHAHDGQGDAPPFDTIKPGRFYPWEDHWGRSVDFGCLER
jgi:hypothetical protein